MQRGYFATAWTDIKQSPQAASRVLLLALVGLVPVFGPIVQNGYAWGWARDIAWNVRTLLPRRVLGNEDGLLYSRGFFAIVIGLVCALAPWLVVAIWTTVVGSGASWREAHAAFAPLAVFGPLAFFLVFVMAHMAAYSVYLVGCVRMTVYGRLSAGLQLGRIWAMLRHDFSGALRVLGMTVVFGVVLAVVLGVLHFVLSLIVTMAFVALSAVPGGSSASLPLTCGCVLLLVAAVAVFLFVLSLGITLGTLLTARAMGYWVRLFDVPNWRGQDDPLPFELQSSARGGTGEVR